LRCYNDRTGVLPRLGLLCRTYHDFGLERLTM
jgi:hypothetical protein